MHVSDGGALSLSLSRRVEQDAFLAAQSHGSLVFGPQATTTAVQVGAAWRIASHVVLAAQAAYGVTPGSVGRLSLSPCPRLCAPMPARSCSTPLLPWKGTGVNCVSNARWPWRLPRAN